jgi:hypothetical protein
MSKNNLVTEQDGNQYEPLLPIEKKLIGWSLGIGVALLIVLAVINNLIPAHL